MPDRLYPRVAEAIAPTLRDIMKRYHRHGDCLTDAGDENLRGGRADAGGADRVLLPDEPFAALDTAVPVTRIRHFNPQ